MTFDPLALLDMCFLQLETDPYLPFAVNLRLFCSSDPKYPFSIAQFRASHYPYARGSLYLSPSSLLFFSSSSPYLGIHQVQSLCLSYASLVAFFNDPIESDQG